MSNYVKLTHDVLDVGEIIDIVTDKSTGAVSLFVGTTRDHFEGKKVVRLVNNFKFNFTIINVNQDINQASKALINCSMSLTVLTLQKQS